MGAWVQAEFRECAQKAEQFCSMAETVGDIAEDGTFNPTAILASMSEFNKEKEKIENSRLAPPPPPPHSSSLGPPLQGRTVRASGGRSTRGSPPPTGAPRQTAASRAPSTGFPPIHSIPHIASITTHKRDVGIQIEENAAKGAAGGVVENLLMQQKPGSPVDFGSLTQGFPMG